MITTKESVGIDLGDSVVLTLLPRSTPTASFIISFFLPKMEVNGKWITSDIPKESRLLMKKWWLMALTF